MDQLQKLASVKKWPNGDLKLNRIGLDVGTKNIIVAYRDQDTIKFRREVNGFLELDEKGGFVKQMLLHQNVPFLEMEDSYVALGKKAEDIAVAFGKYLKRPMQKGTIAVGEEKAMKIVSAIIKAIIGNVEDDAYLYYCIPAEALNTETNVTFHQKIVQAIIDSYKSKDGHRVTGLPINEARAIVLSQIPDHTGIGISFGAGMVNVSYCMFGLPIYEFSIVGSGDWVDMETARLTGNLEEDDLGVERPKALVTQAKESIDLGGPMPATNLDRAIFVNYEILIENVAKGIASGFRKHENAARAAKPMPVVCAGGTSSPKGFIEMFKQVFEKQQMPFEIGEITRADDPLYAVAEGCLIACEMHED